MPNTDDLFFDELKAWSEIKHRILVKYLEGYLHYRGNKHQRIYYVDGFAGTGRYGEDDPREGSPVLVAKLAQRVADEGKSYRLICINTEMRADRVAQLRACLAPFDPDLVQTYEGPFGDRLPEILRVTRGAPAVFFLDPFGPKAIILEHLRPLLQRPDTEILLNLNTLSLRRMAGFEDSPSSKERAAKIRIVSEVLGADPTEAEPEWLRRWWKLQNGARWEEWAAQAYMDQLVAESPHFRFAVRYPVRETYQAHPKYWLVFATRAMEAILLLNDFVCTEEDDLFSRSQVPPLGQDSFFDLVDDANRDQRLVQLVDEIHAYGLAAGPCSRTQIFRHFIPGRWGEFKKAHYRQAVDRLIEAGQAAFTGERPQGQSKDDELIAFD